MSQIVPTPLPSQSRVISALASLYILRMLGLFMVLPVLALAGDEYSGSNTFLLGVALGVYGATQALLQIPFGLLSDRFGRKPLIFIGLILFAAGSVVAGSADTVMGLIVGRALQGAGAIAGVIMAMVGDLTTLENRTKAMASIGASIGVAFALALIIGPWISSYSVLGFSGVRLLFAATVILSLVGIVILFFAIPNVSSIQQKTTQLSLQQLRIVGGNKQCLLLYLGIFVLHYVLMASFIVVPLLLEQANILRADHSWVYLGVMLASFVVMIPLMIVSEKVGIVKQSILATIALLTAAIIAMLWLYHFAWGLITCLVAFFIAFNYLEANLPSLLSKILPPENKGAGSGLFATCQFLGAAFGGVVGGGLYQQLGLTATLLSAILLLSAWFFVAIGMTIPVRVKSVC
jgi:MFS family permease